MTSNKSSTLLGMFGIMEKGQALIPSPIWALASSPRGEAAAVRAIESLEHYYALDQESALWALNKAVDDAASSFRSFSLFLRMNRLPCEHVNPEQVLTYFRCLWLSGDYIPLFKWFISVPMASMAGVRSPTSGKVLYHELPARPTWLDPNESAFTRYSHSLMPPLMSSLVSVLVSTRRPRVRKNPLVVLVYWLGPCWTSKP
jgi:hypothetical protein